MYTCNKFSGALRRCCGSKVQSFRDRKNEDPSSSTQIPREALPQVEDSKGPPASSQRSGTSGGQQGPPASSQRSRTSGGQQGPPASSQRSGTRPIYLHGVVGVLIIEDKSLLDELVVTLQHVNLWLIVDNALFVLPQVAELVLQGTVHLDGDPPNLLSTGKETASDRPTLHSEQVPHGHVY